MALDPDDLLKAPRVDQDTREPRRITVDIRDLIQKTLEANRPFLDGRSHAFSVSLPESAIYVDIDWDRVQQVIADLFQRTSGFMAPGGESTVIVEDAGDEVMIYVRDSSERVDLSPLKELVEIHGGRVGVRSDGDGKGTEVTVWLPALLQARGSVPNDEPPSVAAPDSKKILIVEDNKDFAEPLACLLELRGYSTVLAHDGVSALNIFQNNLFDVVLLDIGLPRMDGYEVARRMRQIPGRCPLIIGLTGYGLREDRDRSKAAGFDHHLLKPFELADLERAIAAGPPDRPEP